MNTGKVVVFEGDFSSNWKVFELVPFLVTAALGGLCGALFIKLNLRLCQYRKTSAMAKYAIRRRRRRHRPVLDRLGLLTITCCVACVRHGWQAPDFGNRVCGGCDRVDLVPQRLHEARHRAGPLAALQHLQPHPQANGRPLRVPRPLIPARTLAEWRPSPSLSVAASTPRGSPFCGSSLPLSAGSDSPSGRLASRCARPQTTTKQSAKTPVL